MAQKRKPRSSGSIAKTILNLVMLLPTFYGLAGKVLALVGYETRLAGRSIVKILLLAFFAAIVLASTWLCLLAMLAIYLVSLGLSYLVTMAIIFSVNLLILIVIMNMIKRSERNCHFRATRRQLHHAFQKHAE
jgi:uncharacterized membrane protein YqjE